MLDELVALRAGVDDTMVGRALDDAIQGVADSLEPSRWIGGTHLEAAGGIAVFQDEKKAVTRLRQLRMSGDSGIPEATLTDLIDRLLGADRELAAVAIAEVLGGDSGMASIAMQQLLQGDRRAADGRYESAVEHYRNAWSHAQKTAGS